MTQDRAALTVKDVVLARSGVYVYSRDEVLARGLRPKEVKPFYREYRPAGVLLAAKDKFNLLPVPKEHPAVDIDQDNFHSLASGVTGGPIEAVSRDDGEIELRGKIAFFTRDAFDYYQAGNVETSAGYTSRVAAAKEPDKVGYDFVLQEIADINHLAIVSCGRGGRDVRVLDGAAIMSSRIGGIKMRVGFLSFLGIGKNRDEGFKLSAVLMDSLVKAKSLDAGGIEKEIGGIAAHVAALGDSEAKEVLAGAVADCFKNVDAVLARKDEVSRRIDELYGKCQDADAEAVKRILDTDSASGDGKDKEGEGKNRDAAPPDIDAVINSAVEKAFSKINDGIDAKIDAAMKRALGTSDKGGKAGKTGDGRTDDPGGCGEDASYLVRGVFGNR
jgi:hypothetical protein